MAHKEKVGFGMGLVKLKTCHECLHCCTKPLHLQLDNSIPRLDKILEPILPIGLVYVKGMAAVPGFVWIMLKPE